MDRLAGRLVKRLRDGDPDEPAVVGLESEDADQFFDALGSETSRAVLQACYEEGRTRSELADALETSIQNVGYHVDKLESAGLLEAVETRYGENGREVTVYEPSKQALVVAAGEPGLVERLADALEALFAPVVFVGLLSMVAGVHARGPAPIGMLGSDDSGAAATTTTTTTVSPALVVASATFLIGLVAVFAADRLGVLERSREPDDRRCGPARVLYGARHRLTRLSVFSSVALVLGTFLALDLVATGAGPYLSMTGWLAVQLAIPAGVVVAVVSAYANDGLLVSWAASSAPFAGIGGYVLAGLFAHGGFDPVVVAVGLALITLVGTSLGSIAYLLGRAGAAWRGRTTLSRRLVVLVLSHPPAMALVLAAWVRIGG